MISCVSVLFRSLAGANQSSILRPTFASRSMKLLIRQFVDWPPWKQARGAIEPYPLLNLVARFSVSPTYAADPSTEMMYTPGVCAEGGIWNLQNGPEPHSWSGNAFLLSYRVWCQSSTTPRRLLSGTMSHTSWKPTPPQLPVLEAIRRLDRRGGFGALPPGFAWSRLLSIRLAVLSRRNSTLFLPRFGVALQPSYSQTDELPDHQLVYLRADGGSEWPRIDSTCRKESRTRFFERPAR